MNMNLEREKFEELMCDYSYIYGNEWFYHDPAPRSLLVKLEKSGQGLPRAMWPPQMIDDDELKTSRIDINDNHNEWVNNYLLSDKLIVPVIWQKLDRKLSEEVHLEPLICILTTHHDFLKDKLNNKSVVDSYVDPKIYSKVIKYMSKWRKTNNPNPTNVKKGDMVRLDPKYVPFAKHYPIALIQDIKKRDYNLNIQVIHVDFVDENIKKIRGSEGWIDYHAIKRTICDFDSVVGRKYAFSQELLQNNEKRIKRKEKQYDSEANDIFVNYLGKKVKNALNETNFVKNRNKQKSVKIEQEVHSNKIQVLKTKLNDNSISYRDSKRYLQFTASCATELALIIGAQNIQRIQNGYKYIPIYPMQFTYGYLWQFPRLSTEFNVNRKNLAGNIEK